MWRQQVCERSWHSLAQHFAILLSDRDSERLLGVQKHVLAWKEAVTEFTKSQQSLETQLHAEVRSWNALRLTGNMWALQLLLQ